MRRRAVILVLDGVGIGAAPDAAAYGDAGSDTLGNLARALGGLNLPNLAAAGLGNIAPFSGISPAQPSDWRVGRDDARLGGEGQHDGPLGDRRRAPGQAVSHVSRRLPGGGARRVRPSHRARRHRQRGRERHGDHRAVRRGARAHGQVDRVHLGGLGLSGGGARGRGAARRALRRLRDGARDARGAARRVARHRAAVRGRGRAYKRTANRRDYSLAPPEETLLDALAAAGVARTGVGKVDDLFAGRSLRARHTKNNGEGIVAILEWLRGDQGGLLFANLVDFDTLYGHRNDPAGFERALREFDDALPALRAALREDDLLFITADHGNDPTTGSTDHARECVPLLALGEPVHPVALGDRATLSDLGATVAEWLNVGFRGRGTSFLPVLERGH